MNAESKVVDASTLRMSQDEVRLLDSLMGKPWPNLYVQGGGFSSLRQGDRYELSALWLATDPPLLFHVISLTLEEKFEIFRLQICQDRRLNDPKTIKRFRPQVSLVGDDEEELGLVNREFVKWKIVRDSIGVCGSILGYDSGIRLYDKNGGSLSMLPSAQSPLCIELYGPK